MQCGHRFTLNKMPLAQVRALVSRSRKRAEAGEASEYGVACGQVAPGQAVLLQGEFADANCYLVYRTLPCDHAFCAKLCVAAGVLWYLSPISKARSRPS
jgi:hypothetical protein